MLGRARRYRSRDRCQPALRARRRSHAAGACHRARASLLLRRSPAGPPVPSSVTESAAHLPRARAVPLRAKQLSATARASTCRAERVGEHACARSQMQVTRHARGLAGHTAGVPLRHRDRGGPDRGSGAHRRLRGDSRDRRAGAAALPARCLKRILRKRRCCEALAARGYQEAITYAFVDPAAAAAAVPRSPGAGAVQSDRERHVGHAGVAVAGTVARGAARISAASRIASVSSSTARASKSSGDGTREIDTLAAIACGPRLPEQWGVPKEMRAPADFYDVKSDLEALLRCDGRRCELRVRAGSAAGSAPGAQRARAAARDESVGWLGRVAPDAGDGAGFYICAGAVRAGFCCGTRGAVGPSIARFRAFRRCVATLRSSSMRR